MTEGQKEKGGVKDAGQRGEHGRNKNNALLNMLTLLFYTLSYMPQKGEKNMYL
jgi:hypothetical protein